MYARSVILSVKKTDAKELSLNKYNNMHTTAQRKIAALRRVAGRREGYFLLECTRERHGLKHDNSGKFRAVGEGISKPVCYVEYSFKGQK